MALWRFGNLARYRIVSFDGYSVVCSCLDLFLIASIPLPDQGDISHLEDLSAPVLATQKLQKDFYAVAKEEKKMQQKAPGYRS